MSLPPLFDKDFPKYIKQTYENLDIYWYQPEFMQSRYPPGQEVNEACTLICLLVAQRIGQRDLQIYDANNQLLNIIIAESIIEGNQTHSYIIKNKLVKYSYLSIDEALKFCGKLKTLKEWGFQVFYKNLDTTLYNNLKYFLCHWYKNPKSPNLFMLLITCKITILFIFQEKTRKVTLFDSHGHNNPKYTNRGLIVVQSPIVNLETLCNWYITEVIHGCNKFNANEYELAFLYYQQPQAVSTCCKCTCNKL